MRAELCALTEQCRSQQNQLALQACHISMLHAKSHHDSSSNVHVNSMPDLRWRRMQSPAGHAERQLALLLQDAQGQAEGSGNAPVRMAELGRVAADAHRASADAQAAAAAAARCSSPFACAGVSMKF